MNEENLDGTGGTIMEVDSVMTDGFLESAVMKDRVDGGIKFSDGGAWTPKNMNKFKDWVGKTIATNTNGVLRLLELWEEGQWFEFK